MSIWLRVRRALERLKRFLIPVRLVKVYVYELVAYGRVIPPVMKPRAKRETLLEWECVFDEFRTLVYPQTEVERRYKEDIEKDLVPKLEEEILAGRKLTYQYPVKIDKLLKLPLARFFKEWLKMQKEIGKDKIIWSGVCKLELVGVSAELKEIVEVEEDIFKRKMKIWQGRVVDDYRFGMIRPYEDEPFDVWYGEWEHDIV